MSHGHVLSRWVLSVWQTSEAWGSRTSSSTEWVLQTWTWRGRKEGWRRGEMGEVGEKKEKKQERRTVKGKPHWAPQACCSGGCEAGVPGAQPAATPSPRCSTAHRETSEPGKPFCLFFSTFSSEGRVTFNHTSDNWPLILMHPHPHTLQPPPSPGNPPLLLHPPPLPLPPASAAMAPTLPCPKEAP